MQWGRGDAAICFRFFFLCLANEDTRHHHRRHRYNQLCHHHHRHNLRHHCHHHRHCHRCHNHWYHKNWWFIVYLIVCLWLFYVQCFNSVPYSAQLKVLKIFFFWRLPLLSVSHSVTLIKTHHWEPIGGRERLSQCSNKWKQSSLSFFTFSHFYRIDRSIFGYFPCHSWQS